MLLLGLCALDSFAIVSAGAGNVNRGRGFRNGQAFSPGSHEPGQKGLQGQQGQRQGRRQQQARWDSALHHVLRSAFCTLHSLPPFSVPPCLRGETACPFWQRVGWGLVGALL